MITQSLKVVLKLYSVCKEFLLPGLTVPEGSLSLWSEWFEWEV